jgi:NADPH:quinone reductase-like Zn-dependent oxidoreductase
MPASGDSENQANPILGSDIAGRVEAVGKNVNQFQPGDEVFGEMAGYHGGFAEYACTSQKLLAYGNQPG